MPALPLPLVAASLAAVLTSGTVVAAGWPDPPVERLAQAAAAPARAVAAEPAVGPEPAPRPVASPSAPAVAAAAPVAAAPVPQVAPSSPAPRPAAAAVVVPEAAAQPPSPRPAPAPAAPAPVAPAPAPAPAASSGPSAEQYADALVAAANAERTGRGLPALVRDGCADGPARRQAERMARAGSLSHQELGPVLDACGGSRAAENVGSGNVSPERLVELWMASEGHRRNLLDPALTSLGSGAVRHPDGRWFAAHVFLGR